MMVEVGKKRRKRKKKGRNNPQRQAEPLASGSVTTRVPKWVDVEAQAMIVGGPFDTFRGIIEEILPKERVKLQIEVFGRATSVVVGIDNLADAEYARL